MNPFETLGLPARFDLDLAELESRYRELSRVLHPDKFAQKPASERRMSLSRAVEVNEAYRTLKDELSRARALLATLGRPTGEGAAAEPADPELLMDVMELREALAEARMDKDLAKVAELEARVSGKMRETHDALAARFAEVTSGREPSGPDGTDGTDTEALDAAAALLGRMRYYRRFLDEVAVIEEEAMS
jgi:molecular chaperone HscB